MIAFLAFIGFAATIPAANYLIGHFGTCYPGGPCVIPVGLGLSAPSGVLLVGLALVLRDIVHERGGFLIAVGAIALGSVLSALLATPELAFASMAAFFLAEAADLLVYTPLRKRNLPAAVFASGVVGAFIDSAVFLLLAFGSLDFLAGNVLGKAWASLAALVFLIALRGRREARA